MRTPLSRVLLTSGVAGLVAVGGIAAVTVPAGAAAVGCAATYTIVSQWADGFQANVSFTNLGDPLNGWTIGFDFPTATQGLNNGWNATWSQSGTHVTAAAMNWNAAVGTNASVAPGFVGTLRAGSANPVPTQISVNGVACTGSVSTPPTTPPTSPPPTSPPPTTGPAPALHVAGNKILTAAGRTYRLLGVNMSSGEFACVQGKGVFDNNPVDQAAVDAMKTWNIHSVRVPLNEDCWLGTFGTPSGAPYQQAVRDFVNLLVTNGITPILDLHWTHGAYTGNASACADVNATCQKPMPDAQFAPTFWSQLATMFKGNDAVVFDLFNEPHPDAANNFSNATAAWTCLRDGGACAGIGFPVAGMQSLVNAVRATGATNLIMTGGLTWTNDLSQWLTFTPTDPTGNLAASWHSYNFNGCANTTCWDNTIGTTAAQVPVVAGEIGQNTCAHDYIDQVMTWADAHGVGYLAWTWNAWGVCNSVGNVLIDDFAGTPTATFGQGFKTHLLAVQP
jgi:endoglucanase